MLLVMSTITTDAQTGVMRRQRHEEAARYGSQQREAAAQQLNLHPSAEKAAPVQDESAKGMVLSKASPDVIRDAVREKVAKSSSATDQQRASCGLDAPKQLGAQMHSRPQLGATGSSRDHSMPAVASDDDGAAVQQTEAASAAASSAGKLCCLSD